MSRYYLGSQMAKMITIYCVIKSACFIELAILYANFYSIITCYMVLSFFHCLNHYQFCVFTIHHASTTFCRRSQRANYLLSIEYLDNGDIQVSEHEEITIDPVIQATSHRRQIGAMRGAAKPLSEFQYGRIFTYLTLGKASLVYRLIPCGI